MLPAALVPSLLRARGRKMQNMRLLCIKAMVAVVLLAQSTSGGIEPQIVSLPPRSEYFTVAILEHARVGNWTTDTPEEIVMKNLQYYKRATALAKSKGADIIAFPEYGIFPFFSNRQRMRQYLESVPDPNSGVWNPCIQKNLFSERPMLRNLSCMAMEHGIFVLANTGDIELCNLEHLYCPEDGAFHYNANAVFDRTGTLVSRYRKEHLFFEIGMDLPEEPQNPVFNTDFGTFAHFICFDSIFKHIVNASHMDGVDAVILSTMWIDSMPTYNSIQYFQGWAIGNNATFIASNAQLPAGRAVGSGVFAGRSGAVAYTFNPDGRSKLLVSKAPKSKHSKPLVDPETTITILSSNGTELYNESDVDFNTYLPEYCSKREHIVEEGGSEYRCIFEKTTNYTFVKLVEAEGQSTVCNNGMCCSLDYSTLNMNESFYLGVLNSTHNSFNRYFWCEEKCMVIKCEDFEGEKCSLFPLKSNTVFTKLQLTANFTTPYVYPSVMKSGMRTATPETEWSYGISEEGYSYSGTINYVNSSPNNTLVIATLTGRCYDRDPPYIR